MCPIQKSKGNTMTKKINTAIIGTGFIGDYHARALRAMENVDITVACGLPLESAQKFAEKYDIKAATTDALSLVQREDIDAVIIGIPNKFHAPYALEFIKNGKDVLIEKPLAMNSKEGEQIIAATEEHKRVVMVGHMWRFDTEINYVKQAVDSGMIGKVIKTKGYGIHENWGPSGWFTEKEMAGGGALADMGLHPIDTVRYILGNPAPKQVYAKIGTYYGDYDVDDTGIIMVTWEDGTTSIIESGWWQPHMDGPESGTRLFGTKGYASVFPTMLKFKVGESMGEFKAPMPHRSEHCDQVIYDRQMTHFIDCIRKRKTPLPGLSEGQTILNIVDAAYKSSRSGKAIEL
jgi:predicted dehydrogenase